MVQDTQGGEAASRSPADRVVLAAAAVVLVDSISYAMILPVLPFVVMRGGGTALTGGGLVAAQAAMAVMTAPLLGRLSDRIGRRKVAAGTMLVAAAACLMFGFAQTFWLLLASRLVAGATAGNIAVIQAAAVEGRTSEQRGRSLGALTAAWALGFVLGPAFGWLAAKNVETMRLIVGLAGAAFSLTGFVLAATGLPGGRSVAGSDAARSALPWWSQAAMWSAGGLAFLQTGLVAMTGYWASQVLGWKGEQVSLLILAVAVAIVVAQLTLLPWLMRRFGAGGALMASLGLMVASGLAIALTPSVPIAFAGASVLFSAIAVAQAACAAMVSAAAGEQEQGARLGAMNGVAAVGRVFGPVACGWLFANFSPSAPYLLCVGVSLVLAAAQTAVGAARLAHR